MTRLVRPGMAGLFLLVGCGTAPTAVAPAPSAPEAATPAPAPSPTPPPASPPPPAAPPSPAIVAPAPATPAPPESPTPPPAAVPGGGGSGATAPYTVPAGSGAPAASDAPARLPIQAIAVDSEMASAPKAGLADGDAGTRWSSRSLRGAWAQASIATARPVYAVSLQMPPGLAYDLSTSLDGRAWTTRLRGVTNATWNPEWRVLGAGVKAKFVRVAMKGATTIDRPFSILELTVHPDAGPVGERPSPPPWARPASAATTAHVEAAGVGYMTGDHTTAGQHIHAYLRVWYDGRRVEVPANLGIVGGKHATMHTHDTTGTIHMEGPVGQRFTLGQFFTIWGVPMTGLKLYVQGRRVADPAGLVLTDKLLLKAVYGTPPAGEGLPLE